MNRILIVIIFISVFQGGYTQELKTITNRTTWAIEKYEVLKTDKKIKNGDYSKKTSTGKDIIKGKFKNNVETGIWEFYDYRTGELDQKFDYDNKKYSYLRLSETTQSHFLYNGQWIFDKLDTIPIPLGALSSLKIKLVEIAYSHTKAPNFPKAGIALFSFIITTGGETRDFKISKSAGNSFEDELLKVIQKFKEKWRPGTYKGELVETEVFITMNVRYQVDSPEHKIYFIEFDYPILRKMDN